MATNAEIYKTAEEREIAFRHFCRSSRGCDGCPVRHYIGKCEFLWLELEVKYSRLSQCPRVDDYLSPKETREVWQAVVNELKKVDPIVADYCVPMCVYRGSCHEINSCGERQ